MKLREIYNETQVKKIGELEQKIPKISFEVFPPKEDLDGKKVDKLLEHLMVLKKYNPAFVSLTYGAGGSTRNSSLEIIKRIQKEKILTVMPHFTCVATEKSHIDEYLENVKNLGVENILALRGDIPKGLNDEDFDFHHANEIVEYIKSKTDFSIGVAGYPEGHISCDNFDLDMQYLKQKVNCGADTIFTQMFFDNKKFFQFREKAEKIGITVPITAGIMIIRSYKQLDKMLSMGRVTLPENLKNLIEKFKENPDDIKKIGIDFATKQCRELMEFEVSGLHFYTLNSSVATSEVLNNLC